MYDNADADEENVKALKKINEDAALKVKIPAICEYKLRGLKVKVEDNKEKYKLPDAVQERFDEIFAAHATSTVFNQLNIRMNDWEVQGDAFVVRMGRTTYFDSLVTNRAMDYR